MLILNSIENFFFGKTSSFESKEKISAETSDSNFHEILHQAVNEAAKPEPNSLNFYSNLEEKEKIKDSEIKVVSLELPNTKIYEEKLNQDSFKVHESTVQNVDTISNTAALLVGANIQSSEFQNKENTEQVVSDNDDLPFVKLEDHPLEKEKLSDKLLESYLKIETKTKEEKPSLVNKSLENKENTTQNIVHLEKKSENVIKNSAETTTQKKNVEVAVQSDLNQIKSKDIKVQIESNDLTKEINLKSAKVQEKGKTEELQESKPSKSKENTTVTLKASNTKVEVTPETTVSGNISNAKEESIFQSTVSDTKKTKKVSDQSEQKEKSNIDLNKQVTKEATQIERESRFIREAMLDVPVLDKSKWTIRREKETEGLNLDRKKESISLLNETAIKVATSQNSNDSEKSFSNPKYDANTLKSFGDSTKAANVDKPKESSFDRENFSKSLNDLVSKARINIVENGKNSAQISLYPKELGRMTLNIDVIQERVEGKILVDSEFIKNRLLGDVSQLKADLKANGLELQNISIEVRNESASAFEFTDKSKDRDSSNGEENKSSTNKTLSEMAVEESVSISSRKSYNLVDIKV